MLRCPECEARREGVFEQSVVEELDEQLDQATGALLSDLKQLTQANMEGEVEFFIRALDADLIVPSDISRATPGGEDRRSGPLLNEIRHLRAGAGRCWGGML